jgi:hypothetical protein
LGQAEAEQQVILAMEEMGLAVVVLPILRKMALLVVGLAQVPVVAIVHFVAFTLLDMAVVAAVA